MPIDELIAGWPVRVDGAADRVVLRLVEDSREVRAGDLFVARNGTACDGRRYAADAAAAGAVAILTDASTPAPPGVTVLRCDDPAVMSGRLAERFHGEPSRRLALVGVTGTNGKTTTAHLLRHLLERAGRRCGLVGTVLVHDGRRGEPARLTTPSSLEISGLLARMVEHGAGTCVMEVSSHALHQGRVEGLAFDGAVFTNLSGDHLDYHETLEAYRTAKSRLFALVRREGWGVVNVDDEAAGAMTAACAGRIVTTSGVRDDVAATVRVVATDLHGVAARWIGPWGTLEARVPLVGRHNAMNLLQAMAAAHALGLGAGDLQRGLDGISAPPGRLEPVAEPKDGFAVLVDYAHTDDALENVLRALRPAVPDGGRLRVVFGCGGDRDRTKRPRMARAACAHADDIIVTTDNPRTEDPGEIIAEVLEGLPAAARRHTIALADRAEAIRHAIDAARPGDVIVIAGKGHEDYQIVGTERRPFDDRVVAREALRRRRTEHA